MASDPQEAFLRQRRNVMALSIGLLIFDLGDATMAGVSITGATLKLNYPGVALLTAWIALAYFVWRMWVYSAPVIGDLRLRYRQHYLSKSQSLIECLEKAKHGNRFMGHIRQSYIHRSWLKREAVTRPPEEPFPVPTLKIDWIETWIRLRYALTSPQVSEYILPYILAGMAAVVAFLRFGLGINLLELYGIAHLFTL